VASAFNAWFASIQATNQRTKPETEEKEKQKIPLIFNIKLGLPPKNNKNSCITNNRKSKGGKKNPQKIFVIIFP